MSHFLDKLGQSLCAEKYRAQFTRRPAAEPLVLPANNFDCIFGGVVENSSCSGHCHATLAYTMSSPLEPKILTPFSKLPGVSTATHLSDPIVDIQPVQTQPNLRPIVKAAVEIS
jgi:hypothetical protein